MVNLSDFIFLLFSKYVDKFSPSHLIAEIESQEKIKDSTILTKEAKKALLADSFTRAFQKRNGFSLTQQEAAHFTDEVFNKKNNRYSWNDIRIALAFFERAKPSNHIIPKINISVFQKVYFEFLSWSLILSLGVSWILLIFYIWVSLEARSFKYTYEILLMFFAAAMFFGFFYSFCLGYLKAKYLKKFLDE
ncbi:MAG: hypothetical protein ACSHX0_11440 [Akkermansiaceae bacterium]